MRWFQRRQADANDEPFRPARYEVAPVGERDAADFVAAHHYSGSYPAARRRYGLHRGGWLVGVAVFSVPMNGRVLGWFSRPADAVELGRFVLLDEVPRNGESWFLARCFEQLRLDAFVGVLSFSDPVERRAADGRLVKRGHLGICYQASNAVYTGRGTPRTQRLFADGTVLSDRTLSKLRGREQGHEYAAGLLRERGAGVPWDDLAAWARHWVPRLTRPVRHPGNHRYLWGLSRPEARRLPPSLPYPKP